MDFFSGPFAPVGFNGKKGAAQAAPFLLAPFDGMPLCTVSVLGAAFHAQAALSQSNRRPGPVRA